MPRHALCRLRPLRRFHVFSATSAHFHASAGSEFEARSNLQERRGGAREAEWRFFLGSRNGTSGSGVFGFCRGFSTGRMEMEKVGDSGTGVGSVEDGLELENGEVVGGGVAGEQEVLLELVEGEDMTSDSLSDSSPQEDLFSCEGVDEGFLEDAEPTVDPQGRSYLHVLTVEEVQIVLEKTRADDVQVISVRNLCEWADHLIIASGHSGRHLRGIADAICFEVKKRSKNVGDNVYPTVEGRESEEWMVVDCGSIVVHVFREDIRGEYNLEEMWRKRRPANIKDIGL